MYPTYIYKPVRHESISIEMIKIQKEITKQKTNNKKKKKNH